MIKMQHLITAALILTATAGRAQTTPDKIHICFSHNMTLYVPAEEQYSDLDDPSAQSYVYTRLYIPEQKRWTKMFTTYIGKAHNLDNYIAFDGPMYPASAGALKLRDFPLYPQHYTNIAGMYMPVAGDPKMALSASGKNIRIGDRVVIEGKKYLFEPDTVMSEDPKTGDFVETVVQEHDDLYRIARNTLFVEDWQYDPGSGAMYKDIRYLGLGIPRYVEGDNELILKGYQALFLIKARQFNRSALKDINMLKENMEYDVLWVDTREERADEMATDALSSHSHNYVEPTKRYALIAALMQNAASGKVKIKQYSVEEEEFEIEQAPGMTLKTFMDSLVEVYHVDVISTNSDGFENVEIREELRMENIEGLRFIEDWYIDPATLSLYKRVKGIAFLKPVYDNEGYRKGFKIVGNAVFQLKYWY